MVALFCIVNGISSSAAEGGPPVIPTPENAPIPAGQDGGDVHSEMVQGIDGTRIDLMVNGQGQAIAVATQAPDLHRHKKRKHPLVGENPADEPLNAGLVNEFSPSVIEDASPQLSNDLPH